MPEIKKPNAPDKAIKKPIAEYKSKIIQIRKNINIVIQGGLDPKILLTSKEKVKKETLKYLNLFKDHPYIFNLGHGVLPKTNPNMIDYLVK